MGPGGVVGIIPPVGGSNDPIRSRAGSSSRPRMALEGDDLDECVRGDDDRGITSTSRTDDDCQ